MNKRIAIFGILIAILALAGFFWLDWKNPGDASNTPTPTATPEISVSPSPTASGPNTYTLLEIASHKGTQSCWAAIRGKVYDLTKWISIHPGGPQRIISICGTDATAKFEAQHDNQPRPNNRLDDFYIGELK